MSLDDFHCLEFDDALYMQDNWNPCYEKRVCVYTLLSNMTGICIRKGACILPPSVDECAHSVRLWKTPKTKFTLHIENEVPDYDIECSKAVVLDMLTEGTVLDMLAEGTDPEEKEPTIRTLESRQPFLLEMVVYLWEKEQRLPICKASSIRSLPSMLEVGYTTTTYTIGQRCPLADRYPAEAERYHDLRVGTLAGELDIHQQLNAKLIEGNPELGFHAKVLEG
ncbi:hypothetical protein QFC20_006109 [Naganishia adeliensis]|uniref:Uncharacterized protein n=1 Tax=Naganishia adeliensis TaxID=92952 RepID=A0ACC2VH00_9TREE|nr:hypothetical protein QFC20_006109 [Naganishia adeliensis]